MMFPEFFTNRFFNDEFFNGFDFAPFSRTSQLPGEKNATVAKVMKTDIKETDDAHEMTMDLPGFTKNDVSVELKDGYITVTAEKTEEKEKKGKYVRKERFSGTYKRSFYVGENVQPEDVQAKYEDGVLCVTIAKKEEEKKEEEKSLIEIQ